ncbi:MAG: hypothetical protein AAGN35_10850 [Bacteroidota bacterium]
MALPIFLTLSRFAPRMQRQRGEVLEWQVDRLLVKTGKAVIAEYPYREVERLRYFHFPTQFSRTFQFLSGNLFQQRAARFQLELGTGTIEFYLEANLEFRTGDLIALFGELYRTGVNLEEYAATGFRMLLLQRASAAEVAAGISELRK